MLESKNYKIRSKAAQLWLIYESNLSSIKFNFTEINDELMKYKKKKRFAKYSFFRMALY